MNIFRYIVPAIFLVLPVFLYSDVNNTAEVTAKFGQAYCRKSGVTGWSDVSKGQILYPDYGIKTGTDSYVELEIGPENRVRLKENSEMLIKELNAESKDPQGRAVRLTDFNLIGGDIALKLGRLPKGSLVRVSSPTAVAGARGTSYVVRYDPDSGFTGVGVLESSVLVTSAGEPDKYVNVPAFRRVDVTPWPMAVAQVRGMGILSEKILGKQFIQKAVSPYAEAAGTGSSPKEAKDSAYYELSKKILSIPLSAEKRIEDVLEENPSLCVPFYRYIMQAQVVSTEAKGGKTQAVLRVALEPLDGILDVSLPPMPAVLRPITMKEYSGRFGAKARVTTQRAAQLDGYRRLAELIYGTVIKSDTTLRDMAVANDRITTVVEGVVKGAEIIGTKYFSDGSVSVSMAIRGDIVRRETAKVTGNIFGLNYFTQPHIIGIRDFKEGLK